MSRLVKIRLSGAVGDVQALAQRLLADPQFGIADCSAPYPNRRDSGVRLYLTAAITEPGGSAQRGPPSPTEPGAPTGPPPAAEKP